MICGESISEFQLGADHRDWSQANIDWDDDRALICKPATASYHIWLIHSGVCEKESLKDQREGVSQVSSASWNCEKKTKKKNRLPWQAREGNTLTISYLWPSVQTGS